MLLRRLQLVRQLVRLSGRLCQLQKFIPQACRQYPRNLRVCRELSMGFSRFLPRIAILSLIMRPDGQMDRHLDGHDEISSLTPSHFFGEIIFSFPGTTLPSTTISMSHSNPAFSLFNFNLGLLSPTLGCLFCLI